MKLLRIVCTYLLYAVPGGHESGGDISASVTVIQITDKYNKSERCILTLFRWYKRSGTVKIILIIIISIKI